MIIGGRYRKRLRLLAHSVVIVCGWTQAASAQLLGAPIVPAPVAAPAAPTIAPVATAPRTVKALSGDINPFKGDINPFNGDINPFWGDIDPFYGDIDPFTGDLNPFWGDISPVTRILNPLAGSPAWLTIGEYWKSAGTQWADISSQWNGSGIAAGDMAALQALNGRLGALVSQSEIVWGKAVTVSTGKSFAAGFANPLFAKYGIDRSNPASLAKLSAGERHRFFLDWYDGLMAYSGADRVDHWMATVNWSPAITQQQGSGVDTVIGLLDADARGDKDIANNIVWSGGYTGSVTGHGAGVASLMVSAHDGRGVMGIAPRARVVAYNPFDASYSASWDDVRAGVTSLRAGGASIINASLGVPGWTLAPEWQGVFASVQQSEAAKWASGGTKPVYVIAAGNSGTTQTQNIAWNFAVDPSFLVVGSVDPSGVISSFSNRPGTTCLLKNGTCSDADRLMNRFIVAPGELILVSDGANGVVRRSGTSFAAPIVSGAIALLHDRWPWLAKYPQETARIVLDTAKDLGAPGIDPVYGVGLIDVARSQSPINFNSLTFYEVNHGVMTQVSAPQLLAGGVQDSWEAEGVYFTLYEKIGNTHRDFQVPMSSRLVGWVRSWSGKREQFQRFITGQFTDWLSSGGSAGFSDVGRYSVAMPNGMKVSFAGSAPVIEPGTNNLTSHSAVSIEARESRFGFTAGHGFGALANGPQPGFARSADYAASGGAANPLLGLASGGSFMQAAVKLGGGKLSLGVTEQRFVHAHSAVFSDTEKQLLRGFDPYRASAFNLHMTQSLGPRVTVSFDFAQVREANALLGVQSTLASDLGGGATTDAYSFGTQVDLGRGLSAAFTGTQGRTRTDRGQMLTSEGAISTSAYALSLQKAGVVSGDDLVRVTMSQPLHVSRGTLKLDSVDVVDRLSGEIGIAGQSFGIGGSRRQYVGEVVYAAPIAGGAGKIGLFGKGDFRPAEGEKAAFVAGGHINLRF